MRRLIITILMYAPLYLITRAGFMRAGEDLKR